jgi:hypothetical protein
MLIFPNYSTQQVVMDNTSSFKPRFILIVFIIQVLINWFYSVWIKSQPDLALCAWFMVMPLIFYFYFALAFIAAIGLYYLNTLGLMLACFILLFGSTTSVISYIFIYRKEPLIEMLIVPLVIVNLLVIFYMASNKKYFTKK